MQFSQEEKRLLNTIRPFEQPKTQFGDARKQREALLDKGDLRKSKAYKQALDSRSHLRNLKAERAKLKKSQREALGKKSELHSDLRRAENASYQSPEYLDSVERLQGQLDTLNTTMEKNRDRLAELNKEIPEAEQTFLDAREALRQTYIEAVEKQAADTLKALKQADEQAQEIKYLSEQVSGLLQLKNQLSPGVRMPVKDVRIAQALRESETLHQDFENWK